MPFILCEIEDLANRRQNDITQRLRRISDAHLYIRPRSVAPLYSMTAAYGAEISNLVGDWTFPSITDSVVVRYGENWVAINRNSNVYKLQNLHLQLFFHRGPDEIPKEIISFHWHPLAQGNYGNRPHLHFEMTIDPLPKSHLSVTLAVDRQEQSSETYLDDLLDDAVDMIAEEVLARL